MDKKLSQMSLEELWQLFPVFLTEHQDCWKIWYADEKANLEKIIPQAARIDHIGSTAVSSIWAKPIIDVGDYYEIAENAERIFIGNELPEEYTESESRKSLMGANAKAKANAKYGWYRYDVRFALPVYEENVLIRYNIFHARLLINHAENGRKYLYDILAIKKETSKP